MSVLLLAGMYSYPSCSVSFFLRQNYRYRRGKPASNDIDIVFTHPDATSAKDLCARLVERLRSAGLVTHVMCEYPLVGPAFCLAHCWYAQISLDFTNTMRYAPLNGTRLRKHSPYTGPPTTAGIAALI